MRDINQIMNTAESRINDSIANVTFYLRKVLVAGGIPEEVAEKYSAEYIHGGEWILNDDSGELASNDYHLRSNEYVIEIVKDLENI